jgi:hypothetical protein
MSAPDPELKLTEHLNIEDCQFTAGQSGYTIVASWPIAPDLGCLLNGRYQGKSRRGADIANLSSLTRSRH